MVSLSDNETKQLTRLLEFINSYFHYLVNYLPKLYFGFKFSQGVW